MSEVIDPASIRDYHAHIYYDDHSRAAAARIRDQLETSFAVEVGRWRDQPVGPHPQPMYQVKFGVTEFARIVPWLMLNRGDLTILVHPNTNDAYTDHAHNALWLGAKLDLRLDILRDLTS
ncbi:MAG: DOPA 4,5-dioxygenase family protein [Candidatus Binataceae bacterium]